MCHSGKLSNLQCVMKNLLLFYIVLFWSSLSVQAQYSLQGDGVDMGSNCYQLTAETTNQMGSIWYEELIDLNDTFELQFTMNFGDLSILLESDGLRKRIPLTEKFISSD